MILFTAIAGTGAYMFFPAVRERLNAGWQSLQVLGVRQQQVVKEISEEMFSVPLRANGDATNARLTVSGVVSLTNIERVNRGEMSLRENIKLRQAAELKLKDMFDQQYFEHISPDGHGPGYLASMTGYSYVVVGENLALGNFKDESALVAAWMASPGHRENILNTRFSEIGVAVGRGMYEGKMTWLAVQEFGQPASACPNVDANLKVIVDSQKASVAVLDGQLSKLKQELNSMPRETSAEREAYNQKIAEYNSKTSVYNKEIATLRSNIDAYNAQVRAFNACVKLD